MEKLEKNKTGLVLGGFIAFWHLVWLALIAMGLAEPLLSFMMGIHHVLIDYSVLPFSPISAIMLLVIKFAVGYAMGWVFALIWNKITR